MQAPQGRRVDQGSIGTDDVFSDGCVPRHTIHTVRCCATIKCERRKEFNRHCELPGQGGLQSALGYVLDLELDPYGPAPALVCALHRVLHAEEEGQGHGAVRRHMVTCCG